MWVSSVCKQWLMPFFINLQVNKTFTYIVLLSPQARLISLYFDTKCYKEALQLGECAVS